MIGFAVVMTVVDEHHLLNLVINKPYQGKGYGQQVMHYLFDHARKQGASSMLLEVRASNHIAKQLYQRLGFNVIGKRKNYYQAQDGQRETAWVMECQWS